MQFRAFTEVIKLVLDGNSNANLNKHEALHNIYLNLSLFNTRNWKLFQFTG